MVGTKTKEEKEEKKKKVFADDISVLFKKPQSKDVFKVPPQKKAKLIEDLEASHLGLKDESVADKLKGAFTKITGINTLNPLGLDNNSQDLDRDLMIKQKIAPHKEMGEALSHHAAVVSKATGKPIEIQGGMFIHASQILSASQEFSSFFNTRSKLFDGDDGGDGSGSGSGAGASRPTGKIDVLQIGVSPLEISGKRVMGESAVEFLEQAENPDILSLVKVDEKDVWKWNKHFNQKNISKNDLKAYEKLLRKSLTIKKDSVNLTEWDIRRIKVAELSQSQRENLMGDAKEFFKKMHMTIVTRNTDQAIEVAENPRMEKFMARYPEKVTIIPHDKYKPDKKVSLVRMVDKNLYDTDRLKWKGGDKIDENWLSVTVQTNAVRKPNGQPADVNWFAKKYAEGSLIEGDVEETVLRKSVEFHEKEVERDPTDSLTLVFENGRKINVADVINKRIKKMPKGQLPNEGVKVLINTGILKQIHRSLLNIKEGGQVHMNVDAITDIHVPIAEDVFNPIDKDRHLRPSLQVPVSKWIIEDIYNEAGYEIDVRELSQEELLRKTQRYHVIDDRKHKYPLFSIKITKKKGALEPVAVEKKKLAENLERLLFGSVYGESTKSSIEVVSANNKQPTGGVIKPMKMEYMDFESSISFTENDNKDDYTQDFHIGNTTETERTDVSSDIYFSEHVTDDKKLIKKSKEAKTNVSDKQNSSPEPNQFADDVEDAHIGSARNSLDDVSIQNVGQTYDKFEGGGKSGGSSGDGGNNFGGSENTPPRNFDGGGIDGGNNNGPPIDSPGESSFGGFEKEPIGVVQKYSIPAGGMGDGASGRLPRHSKSDGPKPFPTWPAEGWWDLLHQKTKQQADWWYDNANIRAQYMILSKLIPISGKFKKKRKKHHLDFEELLDLYQGLELVDLFGEG